MLQRLTFELVQPPKVLGDAATRSTDVKGKLTVSLGDAADAKTRFDSNPAKIFARWQANGFDKGTKLRAAWIAEDVGSVAPPNYKIDEATVVVPEATSKGVFSLSRPDSGWPHGSYRVEIYADKALIETVRFTIAK
jgi:hypothetical protein